MPEDKNISRRGFLKVIGGAGAAATLPMAARASAPADGPPPFAMLMDTTQCAGCRYCEVVCAEAHGLPAPPEDDAVLEATRTTSDDQLVVVNRFDTDRGEVFVRRQCMHCLDPACASACLTKAMHRDPDGPVSWEGKRCMGCRFCMISCPFDVPKFQYHSANPEIRKCDMCVDRLREGGMPACAENCPAEAITFGPRDEMLREARRRIATHPDEYVDHIYGEHEAGGTAWLYLASVPFEQLGFNTDIQKSSYPALTTGFLYSVPAVLTVLPPLLLGISRAKRNDRAGEHGDDDGIS